MSGIPGRNGNLSQAARPNRTLGRTLVAVAKVLLAVAILGYLLWQARQHDAFARLVEQPKHWSLLAAGLGATFLAVTVSFLRWHLLVAALGLRFRVVDALRLGSLGFLLNFVTLGSVGGDVFRAAFLAREQPGRRTHAVATVIADRVIGLLTQLLLASVGILAMGLLHSGSYELAIFSRAVLACTAIGWTGVILLLLVPALSGPRLAEWATRLPIAGSTIARLIEAVRAYRGEKRLLFRAQGLSVLVAVLFISSYYLIARGLPVHEPTWPEHLVIVPIASLVGAIPATPNGLGTLEAAMELLYRTMPGGSHILPGDGTVVALAHRLTMIAVALVGMAYYLTHRAEVDTILHEAEPPPHTA